MKDRSFDSFKSWYADKVCEEKYNPEEIKKTALNFLSKAKHKAAEYGEKTNFYQ